MGRGEGEITPLRVKNPTPTLRQKIVEIFFLPPPSDAKNEAFIALLNKKGQSGAKKCKIF